MSWVRRQVVDKRVLDKHLDELDKELKTRNTIIQKDVLDIRYELRNQNSQGINIGRTSVKNKLPPVTTYNRLKNNHLGGKSQVPKGDRLTLHRHSIDISDLDSFKSKMNAMNKDTEDGSVISQMQCILNQTKVRSTKTADEIWMERFQERFPTAAARVERSITTRNNVDQSDSGAKTTDKNKQQPVQTSIAKLSESRKQQLDMADGTTIPLTSSGAQAQDDDKRTVRVSFTEEEDPTTRSNLVSSKSDMETFYRFGDDDGAWRSARKARYLRNYDPPEMILPTGDPTSFVFGRDFNEALAEKRTDHD